jgi:hypothetical protein
LKLQSEFIKTNTSFTQSLKQHQLTNLAASNHFYKLYCCVQLTLSAFRIDNYYSPAVGFSVARSTPLDASDPVTFDIVLIDTHNLWKSDRNCFTASQNGVYFFHYSVGTVNSSFRHPSLDANNDGFLLLVNGLTTHTDVNLLNACIMTSLKFGDQVTMTRASQFWSYSDNMQASLSGFLYSPINMERVKQPH